MAGEWGVSPLFPFLFFDSVSMEYSISVFQYMSFSQIGGGNKGLWLSTTRLATPSQTLSHTSVSFIYTFISVIKSKGPTGP